MDANIVDVLHKEFKELVDYLDINNEVSLRSLADDNFRKSLLLASASFFEKELTKGVIDFVIESTYKDHVVAWLVQKNVINQKYHSWFEWDKVNANKFFALFGADFSKEAKSAVKSDNELEKSIRDFMELGLSRNRLVHQDFASFTLEKTSEEIYASYKNALIFVRWFPKFIREFNPKILIDIDAAEMGG